MLTKKSIVLNGVGENSKRAVLTIEFDGEMAKGQVRLYNFGVEPRGIITLGIYYDNQVVKAGLTHVGGMVFSFACQLAKFPQKFSCAVINFFDGEPKPILYGNSEGYTDQDKLFNEVITSLSQTKNMQEVESILDNAGIDFDEEYQQEVDNQISKCLKNEACKNCEECEYKKFYLNSINSLKNDEKEEETKKVEEKEYAFYNEIKSQVEVLFKNNPSEDYLEKLLPNSKWVKVSLENSNEYYVLGLIFKNDELKYVCYGVPGVYQPNAPKELSGYPSWFPLDEENPQGFGYWLSYQDADSGESVKAVVE